VNLWQPGLLNNSVGEFHRPCASEGDLLVVDWNIKALEGFAQTVKATRSGL